MQHQLFIALVVVCCITLVAAEARPQESAPCIKAGFSKELRADVSMSIASCHACKATGSYAC